MSVASILLSLLAIAFAVAGLLTSMVPVLGFVLAFGAPMVALVGIVLGGTAMSRAREHGGGSALGLIGVIFNGLAFAPALATALTCGMCNACVSVATMTPGQGGTRIVWGADDWQDLFGDVVLGDVDGGRGDGQGTDRVGTPSDRRGTAPGDANEAGPERKPSNDPQQRSRPGLPPPPLPVAPQRSQPASVGDP